MCRRSQASTIAVCAIIMMMVATQVSFGQRHGIVCKGPYQVIRGHGELATPYCEDNYLAAVAREHGMAVSNRAVRENPILKSEICRVIGFDSRVSSICIGHMNEDGPRRF